jgi:hypothetical protein
MDVKERMALHIALYFLESRSRLGALLELWLDKNELMFVVGRHKIFVPGMR